MPRKKAKPRQVVEPIDVQADFDYFVETFELNEENLQMRAEIDAEFGLYFN